MQARSSPDTRGKPLPSGRAEHHKSAHSLEQSDHMEKTLNVRDHFGIERTPAPAPAAGNAAEHVFAGPLGLEVTNHQSERARKTV
jgi:hypothetical protein